MHQYLPHPTHWVYGTLSPSAIFRQPSYVHDYWSSISGVTGSLGHNGEYQNEKKIHKRKELFGNRYPPRKHPRPRDGNEQVSLMWREAG